MKLHHISEVERKGLSRARFGWRESGRMYGNGWARNDPGEIVVSYMRYVFVFFLVEAYLCELDMLFYLQNQEFSTPIYKKATRYIYLQSSS